MVVSKSKKQPAKSKPSTSTKSAKIHTAKTRAKSSRLARSKAFSRKSYHITRRTVLVVIILAMLVVLLSVLFTNMTNPERIVKGKIESIAADYYENYFYDKIKSYATAEKPIDQIMSRYSESGFSKVPLRQLLLFDGERHGADAPTITHYCDENDTNVKIYPVAPYGKKDYHIEYNYSCVF